MMLGTFSPSWIFTLETRSTSCNRVEAVKSKAEGLFAATLSAVGKAGLSEGRKTADGGEERWKERSAGVRVPVLVPPEDQLHSCLPWGLAGQSSL